MAGTRAWPVLAGLALIVLVTIVVASTASNVTPTTRASDTSQAITPNDVKPAACGGITVTALFVGDGDIDTSSDASDLVLGGPNAKEIRTRKGDDCIVAGGGDDTIRCDQNTDVAIGGPGNDSFHATCETQIQ